MNDKPKVYVSRWDRISRAWFRIKIAIIVWWLVVILALVVTVQITGMTPNELARLLTGQLMR
jgi:hypothetical protein